VPRQYRRLEVGERVYIPPPLVLCNSIELPLPVYCNATRHRDSVCLFSAYAVALDWSILTLYTVAE